MPDVNGVTVLKQAGALNRGPQGEDRICGMLYGASTAPSGLAFGTVQKLESLQEAVDLGITADYDTTNDELLYYFISEFFRLSPQGKLWILLVDQSGVAVAPATMLTDSGNAYAKKLLTTANGEIRVLGVAINPANLAGTYTYGLPDEVEAALAPAQSLAEWSYTNFMPVNVVLEGCDIQTPYGSLKDLRALAHTKVSVFIGQDKGKADSDAAWTNRAALGTILGMISQRAVNENIGWVARGNVSDTANGLFTSVGLTDNTAIEDVQASWQTIADDGYIFLKPYVGFAGYYFTDDPTATTVTGEDEISISAGRTKDKAARVLRNALLPVVKSPQKLTSAGKLPPSQLRYLESVAERALDDFMTNQDEISARQVIVDPDSDLVNAPKRLDVSFNIVPTGTIGEIQGKLQFVDSIE